MGARLDRPPGNQRRRACLPASVLVRAQLLIVRVVFLVPAADRNIRRTLGAHVWLPHGCMAHGLAGSWAWVQLRHCMFNWTLALARTQMR